MSRTTMVLGLALGMAVSAAAVAAPVVPPEAFNFGREIYPVYKSVFEEEFGSRNLLMISDFEFDVSPLAKGFPWVAESLAADGSRKAALPFLMDEKESQSGDRSVRVVLPPNVTVRVLAPSVTVLPGKTYTFSVYLKGKGIKSAELAFMAVSPLPDGTMELRRIELPAATQINVTALDEFTRAERTLQAPAGTLIVQPAILATGSGLIQIDAAQFEDGEKATDYETSTVEEMLKSILDDFKPQSWEAGVSADKEHPVVYAFDGRLDTAWTPQSGDLPADIGLIFEAGADIKAVRVVFGDAEHRPSLAGAVIQSREEGVKTWTDQPARVIDGGAVVDYEFDEAISGVEFRYKINDIVRANAKPVIREIYFWFEE